MITVIVLAAIVITLMYFHLIEDREYALKLALKTQSQLIERELERFSDVSQQITSRTRARQQLMAYNEGDVSLRAYRENGYAILMDALNKFPDLVALLRYDKNGELALSVGGKLSEFGVKGDVLLERNGEALNEVVYDEHTPYLMVVTPILDQARQVGTDVSYYSLARFEKIINDGLFSDEKLKFAFSSSLKERQTALENGLREKLNQEVEQAAGPYRQRLEALNKQEVAIKQRIAQAEEMLRAEVRGAVDSKKEEAQDKLKDKLKGLKF